MGKLFTAHRAQSRPLIVARRPSPGPKHHQAYMSCKQSKNACSYSEEQIRGLFRECWRGWEWQQVPAASPVKGLRCCEFRTSTLKLLTQVRTKQKMRGKKKKIKRQEAAERT